jgi:hypothetical protein
MASAGRTPLDCWNLILERKKDSTIPPLIISEIGEFVKTRTKRDPSDNRLVYIKPDDTVCRFIDSIDAKIISARGSGGVTAPPAATGSEAKGAERGTLNDEVAIAKKAWQAAEARAAAARGPLVSSETLLRVGIGAAAAYGAQQIAPHVIYGAKGVGRAAWYGARGVWYGPTGAEAEAEAGVFRSEELKREVYAKLSKLFEGDDAPPTSVVAKYIQDFKLSVKDNAPTKDELEDLKKWEVLEPGPEKTAGRSRANEIKGKVTSTIDDTIREKHYDDWFKAWKEAKKVKIKQPESGGKRRTIRNRKRKTNTRKHRK